MKSAAYWKPEWTTDQSSRPSWLELVNPEWKSYKVKCTRIPDGKKLVFADLDRIVDTADMTVCILT